MTMLDKIHNYAVQTTINNTSDFQKRLIYVSGYDGSFSKEFKTGIMNQNVDEAIWMKLLRGINMKPLILSFRRDLPAFIDVPGESMRKKFMNIQSDQFFASTGCGASPQGDCE